MKSPSFILALVLFLLPFSFSRSLIAREQVVDEIPLHTDPPPGGGLHAPALIPIHCFLLYNHNSVALTSTSLNSDVEVSLINETIGLEAEETIHIESTPSTIPLLGPGYYTIYITLSSGLVIYGSFTYNNS